MSLSKTQRELVSRGAALLLGLALLLPTIRAFRWAERGRAETGLSRSQVAESQTANHRFRRPDPQRRYVYVAYLITGGLGLASVGLIGFALVPTRWLYALNPTPSSARFDTDGTGRWLR